MRSGSQSFLSRVRAGVFTLLGGGGLLAPAIQAAGPYSYYSVTPCRLVDTRGPIGVNGGPALMSGSPRSFAVWSSPAACGIPSSAQAVTLILTFVTPSQDGFLKIWPYNTTPPSTSNINAPANTPAIANGAIVPLGADPSLQVTVSYGTAVSGTAHV